MRVFIRVWLIVLAFWAVPPVTASAQSANDVFNLLDRVLRQIPDAREPPPPVDRTVPQPDRRVAPAEPAPRYQAPRYARADVRETQRLLNELGYDAGPVDGAYGRRTRGALIAFQQDEGLPADGDISDRVLTRLRQSTGRTPAGGAPATAQGGCTPIRFAPGTSAAEITGVAPADDVLCYTLATLSGQTALIEVIEGNNIIFLVLGLIEVVDRYQFTTEQKTYEVRVGQMMRSVVGEPFRIRVSVTGGARGAGGGAQDLESGAGTAIAGVYCQRDGSHKLAVRDTAGGGIEFAITSWSVDSGHYCGARGRARQSPTGWRYEANMSGADRERCAINFTYDNGVTLSLDRDARCKSQCGARATLDRLRFPESSRLGNFASPRIFEDSEFFNNAACDRNSLTISAVPVPRPSIASDTTELPDRTVRHAAQADSAPADGGPAEGLAAGSAPEPAGNTIRRAAADLHQDISCANRPAEEDYATPVLVPAYGDGEITFFYSHDRDIIRVGKTETAQQYYAGAGDDLVYVDGPEVGVQIWGGNGGDTFVVCAIGAVSTHIDMGPHDTAPDIVVIEEAVFADPPDGNPEIWVSGLVTVNDDLVIRVPDGLEVTFGDDPNSLKINVGSVRVWVLPPMSAVGEWRQFAKNSVVIVTSSGRRIDVREPLPDLPHETDLAAVVAAEPITLAGNAPAGWLGRGACPKPAEIAGRAVPLVIGEPETFPEVRKYGPAADTIVFEGDPWRADVAAGAGNDTIYVFDPVSGTKITGGAEADTIILCTPADDGVSLTLELGGTYSSDIDPDTVIIGPEMLLNVPTGFRREITVFQFTPANDRVILRLPEGVTVSYADEETGAVLLRVGSVEITISRADDWLNKPFNWDSVILVPLNHAGTEPATPETSITAAPVDWQWGDAHTYAGVPASMVKLSPSCGEMRDPASSLEITKPLDVNLPEAISGGSADSPNEIYFSHGDDLIRLANTRNAMDVTAGRGDDAIYMLDVGDGLSVAGGSGADTFVICSMHGAELYLTLGPGLSSVDRYPDLVVIEPAVFLNIPDGIERIITIAGFLSVNDRLELRLPPGLEVEPDDAARGMTPDLKIGQVTVTIFTPRSKLDFDSSSIVVVPSTPL